MQLHRSLLNTWSGGLAPKPPSVHRAWSLGAGLKGITSGRVEQQVLLRSQQPGPPASSQRSPKQERGRAELEAPGMTGLGLSALDTAQEQKVARPRIPESHLGLGLAGVGLSSLGPASRRGRLTAQELPPKLHSLISNKHAASSSALGLNTHPRPHEPIR